MTYTTTKRSLAKELAQVKDEFSKEKDALQEQLAIVTTTVSRQCVLTITLDHQLHPGRSQEF